jgi:hypothetical protein
MNDRYHGGSKPTRRWISSAIVAALAFGIIGCRYEGEEAKRKAFSVDEGDTENRLIEVAGPPSRRGEPSPDCRAAGGTSALIYETREVILGGLLGSEPSDWLVVCVNSRGRILHKTLVSQ